MCSSWSCLSSLLLSGSLVVCTALHGVFVFVFVFASPPSTPSLHVPRHAVSVDARSCAVLFSCAGNSSVTQGWLDLDPQNMAAVFCANGKARTSVLLACYLRFEGEESTALGAYRRVWAKRDPEQEPEQVSAVYKCVCVWTDGRAGG